MLFLKITLYKKKDTFYLYLEKNSLENLAHSTSWIYLKYSPLVGTYDFFLFKMQGFPTIIISHCRTSIDFLTTLEHTLKK